MGVAPVVEAETVRVRVRVVGTVQGVGFRPFAYRLAHELGLAGFVLNDSSGVLVEVEGGSAGVREFVARLRREAPPLAVLERVEVQSIDSTGASEFRIAGSVSNGVANAPVTPDTATPSSAGATVRALSRGVKRKKT